MSTRHHQLSQPSAAVGLRADHATALKPRRPSRTHACTLLAMQDLSIRLAPARDHFVAGRFDQAIALLQRLAQQHPDRGEVLWMLMSALARSGRSQQASYYASRVRALVAPRPDALLDLGNRLTATGMNDDAIAVYEQALALQPSLTPAYVGLSGCHLRGYRLGDAIDACRRGLAIDPAHSMLRCNLGVALLQSGRAREACATLRDAARDNPDDRTLVSNHAAATNYAGDVPPQQSFDAHLAYGALLDRAAPPPPRPRPTDPDPERRIRVGILSADLRAHPCGTFIEPWLARHNQNAFSITCYSVGPEDAASTRLRAHPVAWRTVPHLAADQLAQQLRADGTDIALDLSGHTQGHRLPTLHLRPAPVLVTYFGYPNTTGLRGLDARLVDSITDPPGSDALATEPLIRLDPCFLCFPPPPAAPQVGPLPMLKAGYATFGSFNNVAKIDQRTIELWAGVLARVPGSRLLLKYYALSQESVRSELLARFTAAGVDPSRITFDPPGKGTLETLRAYQRVDIALDTFPYHGTTTTCEALFMGIPVVTRLGDACAARVSPSILAAAGVPEWTATTDEQFVSIAAALASDPAALAARRASLRPQVLASALCDQPAFVTRFEGALRSLWRNACAQIA